MKRKERKAIRKTQLCAREEINIDGERNARVSSVPTAVASRGRVEHDGTADLRHSLNHKHTLSKGPGQTKCKSVKKEKNRLQERDEGNVS